MPTPFPLPFEELERLCEEYGTPLQIYDETHIRNNAKTLLTEMKKKFPSFRQFYAVKALPNPTILQILSDEGCGMDCSSVAELWICKQLGIKGDNIMYTSTF